ncbi:MAG TPA: AbgT family transporter, partial [Sphingomonadaceae bacterium]|nr:AbgT family transporter [Sphingomonadaceae bacterium]
MASETLAAVPAKGFLGWIERTGNRLPDPVFLFLWLIAGLIVLSLVAAGMGWSVTHPTEIDEATGQARS